MDSVCRQIKSRKQRPCPQGADTDLGNKASRQEVDEGEAAHKYRASHTGRGLLLGTASLCTAGPVPTYWLPGNEDADDEREIPKSLYSQPSTMNT